MTDSDVVTGKVLYTGPADEKVLDASDLKKADVEGFSKRTFRRGEVTEVPQDVVDALVSRPELFGVGFSEVVDVPVEDANPARAVDAGDVPPAPADSEAAKGGRATRTEGTAGGSGRRASTASTT